jgi:dTDP-4-amino-4,6-dideoxygalactose transaminase
MSHETDGEWFYQQQLLGFNYRMTDLQAALGKSQLQKVDEFIEKRHYFAERYFTKLSSLGVQLPFQTDDAYSAFHLYPLQLDEAITGINKRQVFSKLREKGIGVNVHYIPVHTQPYFKQIGFKKGDFPIAENYYKRAITIPLFSGMTRDEQDTVVSSLHTVLERV